ncbi:MAG: NUDIX domain-containing protein [Spirochaetota bacterium]
MSLFGGKHIRIRVAGMVIREGKILLIAHNKNNRKYWLVPGGGADFGETAADALVREMKEELSIDVVPGDLIFSSDSISPDGDRHVFNLYFSCEMTGGAFSLGDDPRLCDFGFFSAEDLEGLTLFPPCAKQLTDYLRGISQPVYQGAAWEE